MISLLDATTDPNLFAPWFRHRETWSAWFAFLAALFGEKMTDEQLRSIGNALDVRCRRLLLRARRGLSSDGAAARASSWR